MNIVRGEVRALVAKEYGVAKRDHGPLASMHEGYAVLLEEVEEMEESMESVRNHMKCLWMNVRYDNNSTTEAAARNAMESAIHTACEAIQVAAVCKRIMDAAQKRTGGE